LKMGTDQGNFWQGRSQMGGGRGEVVGGDWRADFCTGAGCWMGVVTDGGVAGDQRLEVQFRGPTIWGGGDYRGPVIS